MRGPLTHHTHTHVYDRRRNHRDRVVARRAFAAALDESSHSQQCDFGVF